EIRAANRQMTAIFNTILTVGGAFVFGFFGIEYAAPRYKLDIALRMLIGLVLATVVFFADLYFIIKNMDMDEKPKNTGQPSKRDNQTTRQVITKKPEKLEEENSTESTRIESKAEEKAVRARKPRREK
uniref:Uncharacterized protein n=1 Tax=Acrobeloides nanus TaxID=290746 RepID=A0A914EAU2_9BILA